MVLTFSEKSGILIAKGDSFKCDGTLLPEPLCDEPFFLDIFQRHLFSLVDSQHKIDFKLRDTGALHARRRILFSLLHFSLIYDKIAPLGIGRALGVGYEF